MMKILLLLFWPFTLVWGLCRIAARADERISEALYGPDPGESLLDTLMRHAREQGFPQLEFLSGNTIRPGEENWQRFARWGSEAHHQAALAALRIRGKP